MKRALALLVVVAVVLLLGGCGQSDAHDARAKSDATAAAPENVDVLKARIAAIVAEEHLPGVGIALVTKDRVEWSGGVGNANVANGTLVTADTLFRVGSITKSFIALAVQRLADEKKIALDAKLKDIAPEIAFENAWESSNPVTVAHLLEHTAGFDDFRPPEYVAPAPNIPLVDVLAVDPRSRVSRWAPGTRHSYSNPGYTIAAYLIEKTTGRAYEDYVAETLFAPLGMTTADLRRTRFVDDHLAQGYVDSAQRPVDYIAVLHRPAGSLHASPNDLARLVRLWLGRGTIDGRELFTSDTIAAMEKPRTLPPSGLGVGYGFANTTLLVNGYVAHGHSGGVDGFLSDAFYIPEHGVGWVMLLNTSSPGRGLDRIRKLIVRYLTRDKGAPDLPTGTASAEALASYAGYYALTNPRIQITAGIDSVTSGRTIFVKSGALWERSLFDSQKRLVPTGVPGGFRGEDEGATRVQFIRDADGNAVMLNGMRYFAKTPAWKIITLRGVLFSAFALMVSSLAFALVWIPRWVRSPRFRARATPLAPRVIPMLASMLGLASFGVFFSLSGLRHFVPLINVRTVAAFLVPLAFALHAAFALLTTIGSIRRHDELGAAVKVHSLLVAIAACAVVGWMAYWGLLGLRLWKW